MTNNGTEGYEPWWLMYFGYLYYGIQDRLLKIFKSHLWEATWISRILYVKSSYSNDIRWRMWVASKSGTSACIETRLRFAVLHRMSNWISGIRCDFFKSRLETRLKCFVLPAINIRILQVQRLYMCRKSAIEHDTQQTLGSQVGLKQ